METISPKFQEAEQTPSTRKIKRTTAEHIITEQIKSMIKKKNLKAAKKKRDILHINKEKNDNNVRIRNNASWQTVGARSST